MRMRASTFVAMTLPGALAVGWLAWRIVALPREQAAREVARSGTLAWEAPNRVLAAMDREGLVVGLKRRHPRAPDHSDWWVEWQGVELVDHEAYSDAVIADARTVRLAGLRSAAGALSHADRKARDRALALIDGFYRCGLPGALSDMVDDRRDADRSGFDIEGLPNAVASAGIPQPADDRVVATKSWFETAALGVSRAPVWRGTVRARSTPPAAPPGTVAERPVHVTVRGLAAEPIDVVVHPGGPPCATLAAALVSPTPCGSFEVSLGNPRDANTGVKLQVLADGRVLAAIDCRETEAMVRWQGQLVLNRGRVVVLDPDRFDWLQLDAAPAAAVQGHAEITVAREAQRVLTRVVMSNGRWGRWYLPAERSWVARLESGFSRWLPEAGAPNRDVELALDLRLHEELQASLDAFMRDEQESRVRSHLEGAHSVERRGIVARDSEKGHVDAPQRAAVLVLDAQSGEILALASYPPPSLLADERDEETKEHVLSAEGVRRLAPGAPPWRRRSLARAVRRMLDSEANQNFVAHPVGSAIKPILLASAPRFAGSGVDLFDLVVSGHGPDAPGASRPDLATCSQPGAECTLGLAFGPWGDEDAGGRHAAVGVIGRREFLIGSCNKYANFLGLASMLDWDAPTRAGVACAWRPQRDAIGFVRAQPVGEAGATLAASSASVRELPTTGWVTVNGCSVVTHAQTVDAPLFQNLRDVFDMGIETDVSGGGTRYAYDSTPWESCRARADVGASWPRAFPPGGTIELTNLNIPELVPDAGLRPMFTGASHVALTNVKLAEAYARLATGELVEAAFCPVDAADAVPRPPTPGTTTFERRQPTIAAILAQQRIGASWVREEANELNRLVAESEGRLATFSKTGTTLRGQTDEQYEKTAVFAVAIGEVGDATPRIEGEPARMGRGVVVVAHVLEGGRSRVAVRLADEAVVPVARAMGWR